MERYKNLSGDSGVYAYECSAKAIKVEFNGGAIYLYDYAVTGADAVEKMRRLATAGRGLSTYISRYAKDRYAAKLR